MRFGLVVADALRRDAGEEGGEEEQELGHLFGLEEEDVKMVEGVVDELIGRKRRSGDGGFIYRVLTGETSSRCSSQELV